MTLGYTKNDFELQRVAHDKAHDHGESLYEKCDGCHRKFIIEELNPVHGVEYDEYLCNHCYAKEMK